MKTKVFLILLAVAFGLAMGTEQAWAQHPDLDVTFTIQWEGVNAYDVDVYVFLTDDEGVPLGIAGWLTPNAAFSVWTIHFLNIPEDATEYVFTWEDDLNNWDPVSPLEGLIDWENEEVIDGTTCDE